MHKDPTNSKTWDTSHTRSAQQHRRSKQSAGLQGGHPRLVSPLQHQSKREIHSWVIVNKNRKDGSFEEHYDVNFNVHL